MSSDPIMTVCILGKIGYLQIFQTIGKLKLPYLFSIEMLQPLIIIGEPELPLLILK